MKFFTESEYPGNFVPKDAIEFTGVDYSNGEDYTVVVKGFWDTDGTYHIQELKQICN